MKLLIKSKKFINIDKGILLFNKPSNMTSNFAIQWLKRSYGFEKIGHCGTLDPIATGLLIVCLGKGTKLSSYFTLLEKEYIAHIQLGQETDSDDRTGIVTKTSSKKLSRTKVLEVLNKFRGEIIQTPPLYSAIKVSGKRAYSYARQGKTCDIQPRKVNIYKLELISFYDNMLSLRIVCSKGTYIRSLARDIGRELGVYANLFDLLRSGIGQFSIYDKRCLNYEDVVNNKLLKDFIISLSEALYFIPAICVSESVKDKIQKGQKLDKELISQYNELHNYTKLKLIDKNNNLLAIINSDLRYLKVFPYEDI